MVNIGVAIYALAERNSGVSWLVVGTRRVAFLTGNLRMHPGKRIARFGVVELLDRRDRFPVGRVMALLAIRAQPPLVRIFVTAGACVGQADEGLIQIFDLDEGSISRRNMLCAMTLVAG